MLKVKSQRFLVYKENVLTHSFSKLAYAKNFIEKQKVPNSISKFLVYDSKIGRSVIRNLFV